MNEYLSGYNESMHNGLGDYVGELFADVIGDMFAEMGFDEVESVYQGVCL